MSRALTASIVLAITGQVLAEGNNPYLQDLTPSARFDEAQWPVDPAHLARELSLMEATVLTFTHGKLSLPLKLTLPLNGMERTLYLVPHSLRSTSFRITEHRPDGTLHDTDPGPVTTFRGFVFEEPEVVVAGGIAGDTIHATFLHPNGERHWLEPIPVRVSGVGPNDYVLYAGDQVIPAGIRCQTPDQAIQHTVQAGGGGSPRTGERFITEMAIDASYDFYFDYGSTSLTTQLSELIINTMGLQFERETNIYFQITRIIVRTFPLLDKNDPQGRNFNQQTLDYWGRFHTDVPRDLIVLLDGNGLGGQAPGTGLICSPFSVADVGVGGYPLLDFMTDTAAHEIGHLFGACHCPCGNPPYTMNPIISQANRFGDSPTSECNNTSVNEIIAFRNSISCLEESGGGGIVRNDFFCSAVTLGQWTWGFCTIGASTDGPPGTCATPENDVWYAYVAPCDGTVLINTCPGHIPAQRDSFDTSLVVYRNSACPNSFGEEIACNEDGVVPSCRNGKSELTFNAKMGERYLIRVGGYQGATGAGLLFISQSPCPAPPNNNCLEFENLVNIENGISMPFSTIGATTDGGLETTCNSFDDTQIANDIWFRYTTPCAGPQRVSLCGSTFNTKLAVYRGCFDPTEDRAIACNDDDGPSCRGMASSLEFLADFAGAVYLFRVGGYHGATGTGAIQVSSLNCLPMTAVPFHRGDPNSSGTIDISDGIAIFGYLFLGDTAPTCNEAADVNNDGAIDLSDGIAILNWLFTGGRPPAPPGPTSAPCGVDPDLAGSEGDMGCAAYRSCE